MAGQYSEVTVGTLRRNAVLARFVLAAAVRRDQPDLAAIEHKRLAWLEQQIAYLEERAGLYAEHD